MTGSFFERLKKYPTDELQKRILLRCHVFARFNPLQKQTLVKLLQDHNHVVAFTGDGANDMGALKQADMGLSLSKSETSIAASYVAESIDAFLKILIESRAGLERSYISFKFMAFYSLL